VFQLGGRDILREDFCRLDHKTAHFFGRLIFGFCYCPNRISIELQSVRELPGGLVNIHVTKTRLAIDGAAKTQGLLRHFCRLVVV